LSVRATLGGTPAIQGRKEKGRRRLPIRHTVGYRHEEAFPSCARLVLHLDSLNSLPPAHVYIHYLNSTLYVADRVAKDGRQPVRATAQRDGTAVTLFTFLPTADSTPAITADRGDRDRGGEDRGDGGRQRRDQGRPRRDVIGASRPRPHFMSQ